VAGQGFPAAHMREKGEGDVPETTGVNGPTNPGHGRARSADSFARFHHVAATQPEKLRNLPALAKELGIGESTAYKYRQRLAHLQAEAAPGRSSPQHEPRNPSEPRSAAQPTDEQQGRLTPEEVDQEIANILRMARRIRGLRRTNPAVTDAYIAEQLGIAVADIATTLRFEQGYLEIERRLKHQQPHNSSAEDRSRKYKLPSTYE